MKRFCLEVSGLVQGVGFRPFIHTLATKYSLSGFVLNNSFGVRLQIQGENADKFLEDFKSKLPPLARIDTLKIEQIDLVENENAFCILQSEENSHKISPILPDLSICDDCLKELNDPTNRRYSYAFINCTNCGPRYSIIENIPYDRPYTSMREFKMCDNCQEEYTNIIDRRYHAQPISCPSCGPELIFYADDKKYKDEQAILSIAKFIKNGKIVAIKGIGGFHLVCDALNIKSVEKLRELKHRKTKPFALMMRDLEQARKYVNINQIEQTWLDGIFKPIVLLEKKDQSLDFIAPNTNRLGIFLANTPLHVLLFKHLQNPIIATSLNKKGDPIMGDILEVRKYSNIDGILDFNRKIINTSDDSIMQIVGEKTLFLRLSRGFSPKSSMIKNNHKNILALGANLKNQIAIAFKDRLILSPYLGDMDNPNSFERCKKFIKNMENFYNISFDEVLYDAHPHYQTSLFAKKMPIKKTPVFHHHAHILATLLDNNLPLNSKVLGLAWDGTGYGEDGNIWGGEALIIEGLKCQRVAHLKPFKLLGGDKSIKHIERIAFSMLFDLGIKLEVENSELLSQMHEKSLNSPLCTSVGRLFDAVCFLACGLKEVSYDGESGLLLESLYDENISSSYSLKCENSQIDYSDMLLEILHDKQNYTQNNAKNYTQKLIASKFLNTLAHLMISLAKLYKLPLVLGGGVFQNKTLLKISLNLAKKENILIHFPNSSCPNDGSICLGQMAYCLLKNS